MASSSGRQPNFAALNRGRDLCPTGRPSRWALAHILVLVSSFFLSSPNLSRRRLDVCHTCTDGVALVPISDADLKHAAGGSLKIQDAKSSQNRHLGTIAQLCPAIYSQLRHVSTIGKKMLNSNISSRYPHNMASFGPLAAEIDPYFETPLQISTGFASWQRYWAWASAKLCGVEQRAPPIFGRATITLGIGPHF